jgi:hypothetical protein
MVHHHIIIKFKETEHVLRLFHKFPWLELSVCLRLSYLGHLEC